MIPIAWRERTRKALSEPGVIAALLLALLLGGFALAVDFPKAASGFQSDEASYYTLGHSLARDGDFAFDRGDLARVYQEFPTGPEGIFLKKGRARWIERRDGFPWIGLAAGPDPRVDRLYFGKSFAYPLAAAPFVWLFGTGGFLVLHAVLLSLSLLAAYWFLRARSEPTRGAGLCRGVLRRVGRAGLFRVDHARDLQPVDGRARPVLWPVPDGEPGAAGRRRLVEPLPARRRRAVSRRGDHRCRRLLEADQRRAGGADRGGRAAAPRLAHGARPPALAFVLSCGGLFSLNLAISGEVNYQGGERATYYEAKGFPFMTAAAPTSSPLTQTAPTKGGGAVGLTRGVDSVLEEIVLSRNSLVEVFPANLVYFVLGRHSGLVPYFFPGVLSVLLFLAWRGGRPWFQWITLAAPASSPTWCCCCGSRTPTRAAAGRSATATSWGSTRCCCSSRRRCARALPAIAALAIGGLFTAKLVLNPFYASYRPAEHVKHGPLRWLPIEKSLLNDLPINVTPERVRIQLAGEPRISAYFLDDNAYPPEGEWFWVKGGSRADLLLRAPVREVTDPNAAGEPVLITGADGTVTVKRFAPYRLKQLRVEIRTGDVPNAVTVATGADSQTLRLDAHRDTVSTVRAESGLPYRAHLDQPTSYVYAVSVTSGTGFTPSAHARRSGADERFLGVLVRLVPMYD